MLSLLLLSLLHLFSYRLKTVFPPFLPAVTKLVSLFLINLPHHLLYLDMCDVTTYVTPIVGSFIIFLIII